ncbi:hypothetical protein [Clostridium saccharoperbutylacetonicum]
MEKSNLNEADRYLLEVMDWLYKRNEKKRKAAAKQTANKSK